MKKLFISLIFVLTVLSCAGQNLFKYPLRAYGGLSVGGIYKGYYPVLIDSITSTAGDIKFWSGGAALTAVPGVGSGTWGAITGTLANQIDLALALSLKADLNSPIFTGAPVVPGYVPTSRTVNGHALTGNVTVTATDVGLGNVTNESKATMFTNPLFTGTPTVPGYVPTSTTVNGHALTGNISVTAADVSLGNVTNESKATMFTNPTFTVGITTPAIIIGAITLTATGTELNVLHNIPGTLTSTELGYSDGVTSSIQNQLNAKLAVSDSASFEELEFTIGVTLNSPLAADTTLTHTHFGGKLLIISRSGARQTENFTATNTQEGFRLNGNIITVLPAWQANEEIIIDIYNIGLRTMITLE